MSAAPHELAGLRLAVPVSPTQGTLALALLPRQSPPRTTGRAGPRPPTRPGAVVVPVDQRLRHAIEEWTHRFVQAAVEIVGGDRPVSQLIRWTTRDVYADLHRRALLVARAGGHQPGLARVQPVRPRVRSVHACFLSDAIVECGVHVLHGERSRAVAARFERRDQRWVCTALDFS
ncbi:Rv3235 family protein [Nocardioides sp. LHD-245]|uniref:Rv3235 family protein n=1 Tax=Nocardioides sp. LHD-245 TaxID=3051387 RepID=UPI0027DED6AB|nr:Rv3235 family protein [Nocardioides sp. LHD-245]